MESTNGHYGYLLWLTDILSSSYLIIVPNLYEIPL